ncbi:unnamed protein product, partial [Gongylonema pulchrum]|uniref:Peptidase_M1_N domain-containing protein n=1 Tax=Gongylonema pulchrum TaxID=637853 RepID=A0A183E1B7_9BILA
MYDPSSSANINEATVEHISLDWVVDFQNRRIAGSAVLSLSIIKPTNKIILDSRSLEIQDAKLDGETVKYQIENAGVLGEKIVVDDLDFLILHEQKKELTFIYRTGKQCTALQFLEAEQTATKKRPYLFSQCQAIHARSIIPCMDTPSVKQTYDAVVAVPNDLVCLMSAIATGQPQEVGELRKFAFKQPVRIPSYLVAIVVGLMEKRDLSARSSIWAEPPVVDKAFYEFGETEKMLRAAESLAGKYEWGRYDLVVLPPSFPFGGMENPCLTF